MTKWKMVPVDMTHEMQEAWLRHYCDYVNGWSRLLAAAPKAPRLTDGQIALICAECAASAHGNDDISFARAIEAKILGEA